MKNGGPAFASAAVAVLLLACEPRVTFSEHIAPILQAKCESCHRPGQMAPMSLRSYAETRPLAPVIRASVAIGNMPPFYADGPPGYYKNDIRLTDREKKLIIEWADSGAPEGDPDLLPRPVEWDDSEWPFGEPDLVLHFPAHSPPADNREHWITFFADQAFPENIWARAIHLKTSSRKTVHHSTLFTVGPRSKIPKNRKTRRHVAPAPGLFTWFPGLVIDPLPEGQAIQLRSPRRIAARTHFAPTNKRRTEQMEVGIYFATGVVERVQKKLTWQFTKQLKIPPGASDFTLSGTRGFTEAAEITHFKVHMHLRGKSSRIILHYPDGSKQTVFDLPRYRFNWQRYYYLAEPLLVPKGTVAEFVGVWDNSAANPSNPNPRAWCSWGRRTTDEMFGAAIFYTPQNKLLKPLHIENGRAVEKAPPEVLEMPLG